MQKIKEHEVCEGIEQVSPRVNTTEYWKMACFDRQDFAWQGTVIAENWQNKVPVLLNRFTENLQARWIDALRIEGIEYELLRLKENVAELQRGCPTVVPINTLAPEPLELRHSFSVIVQPYDDEYRADFLDANLTAYGDTRNEAIWNLKDIIASTFETLLTLGEDRLGPGPARQLHVLKEFIRKQ